MPRITIKKLLKINLKIIKDIYIKLNELVYSYFFKWEFFGLGTRKIFVQKFKQ